MSEKVPHFSWRLMKLIVCCLILCMGGLSFPFPIHAQDVTYEDIYAQIRVGRHDRAVLLLEKYIYQNPDSIHAYILLAPVHLAIGGPNHNTAAAKALLDGLRREPHNPEILKRLSEVKGLQNMPEDSRKFLEKAVRVAPSDQELLEELVSRYIGEGNRGKLRELRSLLQNNLRENPRNALVYLSMGKLETYLNRADTAVVILEYCMGIDSTNTKLMKALAEAYLYNGRGNEFTEMYYKWLENEQDLAALELEYEIAALAMPSEETEDFNSLPFIERRNYLLRYLRKRDVLPVTEANEWLIEHVRRVLYSRAAFHTMQGKLGFDDRGKIYVRYGEPEERFADAVPDTKYFKHGQMIELEFIPRANESWYYPSYSYYMAFDFVSYGEGYFHEVASLREALPSITYGANLLYLNREYMGGIYANLAHSSDFDRIIEEMMTERASIRHQMEPRFALSLDVSKSTFQYRTSQFRGDSGRTRIDLAYGITLEQYAPAKQPDSLFTLTFQTELVLLDSAFRRNTHIQNRQQCRLPAHFDYARGHFVHEWKHEVLPQEYQMTFQILELSQNAGNHITEALSVRDFTGNELLLSDLKLSPGIKVVGTDPRTGMERLDIVPYPFSYVSQGKSIFVYFEIYNLVLTPREETNYRIAFLMERRIKKEEYAAEAIRLIGRVFSGGKPQELETSYQREGNSRTAREWIELDISGLKAGRSRLTVTVEDLHSGTEAKSIVEFDLEK